MNITEIPIERLCAAVWNPNEIDDSMLERITESIERYGVVVPLVVRPVDDLSFEVLSGNQRLTVLTMLDFETVPCIIVDLDGPEAMLLAQALNQIHGEDDVGVKAELIRTVLRFLPESSVLSLLPETEESLGALVTPHRRRSYACRSTPSSTPSQMWR